MRLRSVRAMLAASMLLAGTVLLACSDDEEDTEPTSTAASTSAATAEATGDVACLFEDAAELAVAASALVITDLGTGTAFHIGGGQFVTAEHVVSGMQTVALESDTFASSAEVLAVDLAADVALLQASADTSTMPVLEWFDGERVRAGQVVGTAGYPLDVTGAASVTRGAVSRIISSGGLDVVQTDAPVNPGNSGGALFNECGAVVGVVVQKWSESGIEGVAYATAFNTAQVALANGTAPAVVGRGEVFDGAFGDGTYVVGIDLQPGTYQNSDSSNLCYWERLRGFRPFDFGYAPEDVIDAAASYDIQVVTIEPGDAGFFTLDCGVWSPAGGGGGGAFTGEERSVFDLLPGDCFDLPFDSIVVSVSVVDCDVPHQIEAYDIFEIADGPYPGDTVITDIWFSGCLDRFAAFTGIGYESSRLEVGALTPTQETWALGDRVVLCYVEDYFGDLLTGSMRGRGE